MKKIWILPEQRSHKDVQELIQSLLTQRGIQGVEEQAEYLSDNPVLTYDPFLLKDLKEAVQRILLAIEAGQSICVYGDYDCDGVCSVSLMLSILMKLDANVTYYIPSRFEEGYGLNREAIQTIREGGTDLLVTVDCGSVSVDEVDFAKELGLDVIVTDHHNLGKETARCLLVNPKQTACQYPNPNLSGCGVAFKLAQGLQRLGANLSKGDLNEVLDLVAIATIGDIVPLVGENRTLVKYGLKRIRQGTRQGLVELMQRIGLTVPEIKSTEIAYGIVPHLNAAGRMLTAETGVLVLSTNDEIRRREAVSLLVENNKERRKAQEDALKTALDIIRAEHEEDLFLVVEHQSAHEGIAGIVAGKIKDRYHRPTVLVTPSGEDWLKGTGRSIEGVNLYEILSEEAHLFDRFGGHGGACGFRMKRDYLPALRDGLQRRTKLRHEENPTAFVPKVVVDAVVKPEECTFTLCDALERMEPFGQQNRRPVLCLLGLHTQTFSLLGEDRQHVRFQVDGLPVVFFQGASDFIEGDITKQSFDLLGYLERNRWNGRDKLQFVASDIRWYNEETDLNEI